MNKCNCKICKYSRKVESHIRSLPESKQRVFANDMYMRMANAQDDLSFYKGKYKELVKKEEGE